MADEDYHRQVPDGMSDGGLQEDQDVTRAGIAPAALRELHALLGGAFVHELVALYDRTAPAKGTAVRQSAGEGLAESVRSAAHSLASCAGAVGAIRVATCARAVEAEAVAARLPSLDVCAALEQAIADSRDALGTLLAALHDAGEDSAVENPAEGNWAGEDVTETIHAVAVDL